MELGCFAGGSLDGVAAAGPFLKRLVWEGLWWCLYLDLGEMETYSLTNAARVKLAVHLGLLLFEGHVL